MAFVWRRQVALNSIIFSKQIRANFTIAQKQKKTRNKQSASEKRLEADKTS